MKKLTIDTLISTALSAGAFAGEELDKIDTTFADLDNDDNGYISREEADDDEISDHFAKIDANSDMQLSVKEFNTHVKKHPQHFDDEVVASAQSMKASMRSQGTMETDVNVDTDVDEVVAATKDNRLTHELRAKSELKANGELMEKNVDVAADNAVAADKTVIAVNQFEMMDANSDGELTKAEASRSGVTRNFDKIDANDDELITRTEYSQYQTETKDSSDE